MTYPIKNFSWKSNVSQMFGVSKSVYQINFNIPGHNGIDIYSYYGDAILATHDGIVDTIVYDNPHRTKGNGVYIRSTDGKFATAYWHLSQFADEIRLGQQVKQGQMIGLMGNSGWVKPLPTGENPTAGTHLHYAKFVYGKQNEYNGFVDPLPDLFKQEDRLPMYFYRDLFLGKEGDDVSWLQSLLKLEFPELTFEPIGYYGTQTLRAVIDLQKKYQLSPTLGYVGIKTKRILMEKYC